MLSSYSWTWGMPWSVDDTSSDTQLEKMDFFLSQQVSVAYTSWLDVRLCLCFSRLVFCLVYISTGLVHGITITVYSNGISIVVSWRNCFLLSHPWHLVLTIPPSSSTQISEPGIRHSHAFPFSVLFLLLRVVRFCVINFLE